MITVQEFIYKHLKDIATTTPAPAPLETALDFITYSLDGEEVTRTMNGNGYTQNFVTINAYSDEYDNASLLAMGIVEALECKKEDTIIGVTYTSKSTGYDAEPVARYFVSLEFNIYTRG